MHPGRQAGARRFAPSHKCCGEIPHRTRDVRNSPGDGHGRPVASGFGILPQWYRRGWAASAASRFHYFIRHDKYHTPISINNVQSIATACSCLMYQLFRDGASPAASPLDTEGRMSVTVRKAEANSATPLRTGESFLADARQQTDHLRRRRTDQRSDPPPRFTNGARTFARLFTTPPRPKTATA